MDYRILVTGSRDWTDKFCISQLLGFYIIHLLKYNVDLKNIYVVHGDCPKGADAIANSIAEAWGVNVMKYPADWSLGKSAGYIRNKQMVDAGAYICLGFRYNMSKGTTHTIDLAEKSGVPTMVIDR